MLKKLKYNIKGLDWLKVYFSPFKPPIPKLYIGKVAIGTPYFLPRVWRRYTTQEAIDKAIEELNKNPNAKKIGFDKLFYDYSRRAKSQPKKIGFDFVSLGWKTKWTDTDYRFEWSPVWSFVFFKWQIAITFVPIEPHHYWECWLYYSRKTVGSTEKRINKARKRFPCVWTSRKDGVEITTCYWDVILKKKFL
jgi:hypothetical protein